MGVVEQAFPESIDEILSAVKETPRGRWFLENYEKRLRGGESERILRSIARLERHIQSLSSTDHDGAMLLRARNAIATARRDIAAIKARPKELSTEGQLFARLAVLSKQTFTDPPALSKGVERALRLVSDLDQQLRPIPTNDAAFFKPDAEIFEAPLPAEPNLDTRSNLHPLAMPISNEAAAQAQKLGALIKKGNETSEAQHSRIVVIRRKVTEMENVPLLEPGSENPAPMHVV